MALFVDKNIRDQRRAVCNNCDKLIKRTKQCSVCYCFTDAKTSLAKESCPLGKW